jgi:hypothetical protein
MHKYKQQISEGLRKHDLINLVEPLFYVDMHRSKMGEDRDVCVLSFSVKDRLPAKDMMEFIETGYSFVLDADVSAGEDKNGGYTVFVELERKEKVHEQIKELVSGLKRLTGISEWMFRYHKDFSSHRLDEDPIETIVPASPKEYDGFMTRIKTEGIKKFFNKTLMDDLTLDGEIITIYKPFNQQIKFKLINQGAGQHILENNISTVQLDHQSMGEIFWLTKVLGDYGINKIGNQFLLSNDTESLILERIE